MEISLAIDTPDGIVLMVACSHPTIEKIVEAAKATINKPIRLVIGGTHLLPAKDEEISRIATALHDTSKVAWLAPAHSTGEPAFAILQQTFGDHYLYAGLGTTLVLGPTVKTMAEAGQPQKQATDDEDLRSYRELLAQSGDANDEPKPRDTAGACTLGGSVTRGLWKSRRPHSPLRPPMQLQALAYRQCRAVGEECETERLHQRHESVHERDRIHIQPFTMPAPRRQKVGGCGSISFA